MELGIFNNTYSYLSEAFEKEHLKERSFESQSLLAKRAEAFQLFNLKGFPSVKNEDWRFTNLNKVFKEDYQFRKQEPAFSSSTGTIPGLKACKIVLVNGKVSPELSDPLPEGVSFLSTEAALAEEAYSGRIGAIAVQGENAILGFNTAFFKDFYVLHVRAKKLIETPIHISHHFTGNTEAALIAYRLLVLAEELSESTLIETFHSDLQAPVFLSYVSEFSLAESAVLHTHWVNSASEDLHLVHHREVEQFRNSIFNNSNLSLGNAAFIRNNLNCRLKGSGTETNLLGSYVVNGSQHVDNHTIVDHQKPNSNSMELYKGIMLDKSHAVFNGKIFVQIDAQKTNAFQKNNNILLSDQATINSKPQLEIFADDVKCSHGSTVGQFDEGAMFYLRTRGISEEAAKRMLIQAFVAEVHSKINISALRDYVSQLLQTKLERDNLIIA
ncbi:Fe-S cluster assembly protein SufD [Desertivirga arenae]|uniref:Fe-S cluster assembly protein SufD n=1 Tax=Desertivirga arenae TaxID=2810309 RepID=UPI001A95A57D|nr:Fe-S cluster assembly protein SufD [Pedobacter sp. SYSU D00823]